MIWMNKEEINRFWWSLKQGFPFVAFDVETTGLKKTDYIIQFSGSWFEKIEGVYQKTNSINEYIKAPVLMEQKLMDIHHITNEFLVDKPSEYEVFDKIKDFFTLKNAIITGYNVNFDIKMIKGMFNRQGLEFEPTRVIDAYKMVKNMLTMEELGGKRKLTEVAEYYHLTEGIQFHSADDDIKITWEIMLKILEQYKTTPVIPEISKEVAVIKSMQKYEKGMYVKRIYITAASNDFIGELYYDIWNNYWKDTNENYSAIEKFNMDILEKDVLKILNAQGFKTFSSFKGNWNNKNIA